MANVTARFGADFSNFTTAVSAASVKLKDFEQDAKKVQDTVQAIGDKFGGKKIIQDAEMTAKAIESIGGASKLTAAEQAKVNATVTEAIAKYKVLGQSAPQSLLDLAAATTKVQTATDAATAKAGSWKTQLAGVAGAVGVGFSVGAVVNFGKAVFDAGGQIQDMSEKIGISTDAVQGFKFAAEQGGSSLDAVGTSINKMNLELAGGDKSTVAALNDLKLSFSDVATMKPEDAFLTITDALKGVTDQGERTRLGTALLGKGFSELTPAILAGFRDVSAGASKMSAQTIADLAAAGDAWESLYNEVVIFTGSMISEIMRLPATAKSAFAGVTGSVAGFKNFLANVMTQGVGPALAWSAAIEQATVAAANLPPAVAPIPPVVKRSKEELDAAAAAAKRYKAELDRFSGAAATASLKELDRIYRDLKKSGDLTAGAITRITDEALNLMDAGGKLTPELQALVITSGALGPSFKIGEAGIKGLGTEIDVVIPKLSAFDQAVLKNQASVKAGLADLPGMKLDWKPPALADILKGLPPGGLFAQMLGSPASMGQQISGAVLAAIQGGGNPVAAAAGTMGSSIGSNLANMLKKDGTKMFTGALGGIFSAALPVVGGLIGPLADMIMNKLFGSAGRDAVKDFAASFGGFDALQKELLTLGPAYDSLWRGLTQGVGKNNPAEAKKAIDAITTALDAQKQKTAEVAAAAEASGAAQQGELDAIAAKYDTVIGKLQGELDSFSASLQAEADAPEFDEMGRRIYGVLETQQMARKAQLDAEIAAAGDARDAEIAAKKDTFEQMLLDGAAVDAELRKLFGQPLITPHYFQPMGSLAPGAAAPPTEPTLPPGTSVAPTPSRTGGGTAIIQLNGQTLAEAIVPAIPGVVTRYGLGRG